MVTVEEEIENLGIFKVDPDLKEYKDHFAYRWKRYVEQKALIDKHEGGLDEFSKGYTFTILSS
jgi:1,4-alpha-glucan branching enzyme